MGGRNVVGLAVAAVAAPVFRVVTRLKVVAVVTGTDMDDNGNEGIVEGDEVAEFAPDFCFPLTVC